MSTKGHEGQPRATKGLEKAQEGSAKGWEGTDKKPADERVEGTRGSLDFCNVGLLTVLQGHSMRPVPPDQTNSTRRKENGNG